MSKAQGKFDFSVHHPFNYVHCVMSAIGCNWMLKCIWLIRSLFHNWMWIFYCQLHCG